jgi:hypothetical protein
VAGCGDPSPSLTAESVAPRTAPYADEDRIALPSGKVVWVADGGEILAFSLQDQKRHVVRAAPAKTSDGMGPYVHALCGPDSEERIAFIDNYFFVARERDQKHVLKTIHMDGTGERTIFSRPVELMWTGGDDYLAISPRGGKVALLVDMQDKQMPMALLSEGNIEIWDIDKKVKLDATARAIAEPMSWFPDGDRLAYVAMMTSEEASKLNRKLPTYFGHVWNEAPAIKILDIRDGSSDFVDFGWHPVVSTDGKTMLVGTWPTGSGAFTWRLVDLETRNSSPVASLDNMTALMLNADDTIIYRGVPAEGEPVSYTKNNSPLSGPKPMDWIKGGKLNSAASKALVRDIDPRNPVSVGVIDESHR